MGRGCVGFLLFTSGIPCLFSNGDAKSPSTPVEEEHKGYVLYIHM